jgi:hypothetical protein
MLSPALQRSELSSSLCSLLPLWQLITSAIIVPYLSVLQELRALFSRRLSKVSPPKTDVSSQVVSFEPMFSIIADLKDGSFKLQASHLVCCTIVLMKQHRLVGSLSTVLTKS